MPLRSLTKEQYQDNSLFKQFQDSLFDDYPSLFNGENLFRPQLIQMIKDSEGDNSRIPDGVWLIDASAIKLLKRIIKKAWAGEQLIEGDVPDVKGSDKPIIDLIRGYIEELKLCLFVPRFYCHRKSADTPSTYRLQGYDWKPFLQRDGRWDAAVVDRFIDL